MISRLESKLPHREAKVRLEQEAEAMCTELSLKGEQLGQLESEMPTASLQSQASVERLRGKVSETIAKCDASTKHTENLQACKP